MTTNVTLSMKKFLRPQQKKYNMKIPKIRRLPMSCWRVAEGLNAILSKRNSSWMICHALMADVPACEMFHEN